MKNVDSDCIATSSMKNGHRSKHAIHDRVVEFVVISGNLGIK
jgi:hypothetical protein